ncbi:MAG: carbohydrate binding family 9 domain-containing protein [Bacteroidetes bacterium]|nr:carbohydrate binding family 9 domain-containing protein [Bacteroidota bacterium]
MAGQDYPVRTTQENMVIDGHLEEKVWQSGGWCTDFIQHFPYDTSRAKTKTCFMLAHNEKSLFAAFMCVNRNPSKPFVIQSLKRDFSVNLSDAVVLTLSPFQDGQNGFSFGVTPQNAQREGAIEGGGQFGVTTAWDQIWHSATQIKQDTWFAEFEIPLKSIRFVSGMDKWKLNVARVDLKNNEVSTWIKVPRNFNISVLNFTRDVKWERPPRRKGPNISLIPYVSSTASGAQNEFFESNKPRLGMDIKVGLSSSLNLDMTLNPDFAQVDVDEQQLNLTRFSLFFPERRQFFIENSDLFAGFGFRQIRPFFSRRIGLGNSGPVPISAGLRVTGKIGNDLRIGLMNVQVRKSDAQQTVATNYTVAALQYKVFGASNIGWILVNQAETDLMRKPANANTVTGLEYNLLTKNNRWIGKAFVQKSFFEKAGRENWSHASFLLYKDLKWEAMWNHEYVGKDFRAQSGFVPRIELYDQVTQKRYYYSYYRLEPSLTRTYYPKSKLINNYSFNIYNSSYYDSAFRPTESFSSVTPRVVFQNSAEARATFSTEFFNLYLPFSPIATQRVFLIGQYQFSTISIGANSNTRKRFNASGEVGTGTYFSGVKTYYTAALQWRKQPRWNFSLSYRRVNIDLPEIGKSTLNLVAFKTEYSISTIMYLTAFLQYNTQRDNVNINVRYQYRFRPMSDFFVVYSENYLPDLKSKDRSLAFKLVYWFNT